MDTFEITIQRRAADGWPVVVEQAADDGTLPVRSEGMLTLDPASLLPLALEPRPYGVALGKALFTESVRDAFTSARTTSADDLRVLLEVEAPDLRSLRWERLCAPFGRKWAFLALDQRAPFSLYLPSVTDRRFPPFGRRDLRALVVVASPQGLDAYDLEPFDTAATIAGIRTALGDIPCDALAPDDGSVGPPTLDALADRITAARYTLLHIVCHGQVLPDGETALYLSKADGQVDHVSASQLIERLGGLGGARGLPHLAFLAACESASGAAEAEGAFGGLAQRLVRELGMPAVVAMTDKVTVATAGALASAFYRRLREHGEVDRALVESTAGLADRGDVTVPALYSRLGGRPLFSDTDHGLTPAEIAPGLDLLAALLPVRAPVLEEQLNGPAGILRGVGATDPDSLSASARDERDAALAQVRHLCLEATDLDFDALALGQMPPAYDDRQPFRGLYPFRAEDRVFFFGRDGLVTRLRDRLDRHPFLAVLGPSGSGKSSLVLAGLLPSLGSANATFTPGPDPPAQLEAALAGIQPDATVVVDQFEELFTLCREDTRRRAFIGRLLGLIPARQVVLTMRADFWGECAPYPELRDAMQAHQELIAPMDATELRRAMEQQASAVGLRFEADLANTVLDEVQGEPGAMPLLQHALLELWKRRHGRWLRADEYRAIGGVRQAIAHTADDLYGTLDEADRARVHDIFVRLTRLDDQALGAETGRDTRRRVADDDLVPAGTDPALTKALIARLADARLVVTSVNAATGRDEVEVAHEALIRYWPLLRGWLDAGRADLRLRAGVTDAAIEWDAGGRSDDLLVHRAGRLDDAVRLSERLQALNALELAYVHAAVAFQDRERQGELEQARALAEEQRERRLVAERAARRQLFLSAGLAGVVVLAVVAAGFALLRQSEANTAKDQAEHQAIVARSRQIASQSLAWKDKELDLALLLGIEASRFSQDKQLSGAESFEARSAILAELTANPRLATFLEAPAKTKGVAFSPDGTLLASVSNDNSVMLWNVASRQPVGPPMFEHTDKVQAVAFSPDGRLIASGSEDGTVIVWDVATRQPDGEPLAAHPDAEQPLDVTTLDFSPDGRLLAAGGEDTTITLWDVATRDRVASLEGRHTGWIQTVAFSPDGTRLASGGMDGTVVIWDVASRRPDGAALTGASKIVQSVAFSPDGRRLASGDGRTVLLWDLQTRLPLGQPLTGHGDVVQAVAFSADGTRLASGSEDGTVTLWNPATGQPVGEPLTGSTDRVYTVDFGPDGRLLATGDDRTIVLWDVGAGQQLGVHLGDPAGRVFAVAFSPDGTRLAVGNGPTVSLWDMTESRLLGTLEQHTGIVDSVAFSPDGTLLASGSNDKTVIVWDVATGDPRHTFADHTGAVLAVAFSPDGTELASGSRDSTIRRWDVATGQPRGEPLTGHGDTVATVAYSTDGKHLVSGGLPSPVGSGRTEAVPGASVDDRRLLLEWDLTRDPPVAVSLAGHSKMVRSAAYSPDGTLIASGGADTTVVIQETLSGRGHGRPLEHPRQVYAVAFSPDRTLLATGSNDKMVRLWDIASGQQLGDPLGGHTGVVTGVAFDRSGTRLASGSDDGTVIVWDVDPTSWIDRACIRANRNLTEPEQLRYFPDEPPTRLTCPRFPPTLAETTVPDE